MWATNGRPAVSASDTAKACVERMRNTNQIKTAVLAALSQFDINSLTYQIAATADALHTLTVEDVPAPGGLTDAQMHRLYKEQLASPASAAHHIYRTLQLSGPGRRCAYCRYQVADSLDHVIPKALMSALSIEPWNLVPACSLCNRRLLDRWPTDPAQRMLHPYFMPTIGRWLYATVDNGSPGTEEEVVVRFRAQPDSELGEQLCGRVRFQFKALRLGTTFGTLAVDELRPIQATLRQQFERKDDARDHLSEQADIHLAADVNNLRGVLYEALAQDDTFIGNHLKGMGSGAELVGNTAD